MKRILIIMLIGSMCSLCFGAILTNGTPEPLPPGDPNGNGRKIFRVTELPHEKYVKQGAACLFEAFAKINLAFAKYELDEKNYDLLRESLPLFQKAKECFIKSSETVNIDESYKDVFRNYRYYYSIIYNPRFKMSTMLEVCRYVSSADFRGLHYRVSEIVEEMMCAVQKVINDFSRQNVLDAYRVLQNQFPHYSTTVCRIIAGIE